MLPLRRAEIPPLPRQVDFPYVFPNRLCRERRKYPTLVLYFCSCYHAHNHPRVTEGWKKILRLRPKTKAIHAMYTALARVPLPTERPARGHAGWE